MDKEKDFDIPQASVLRILKASLPTSVQVTKEAKIAFAKAAGIFVLYLTSVEKSRQTVSAGDVFDALKEIDLEDFIEPLKKCLEAQRSSTQAKKKAKISESDKPDASESQEVQKGEAEADATAEKEADSSEGASQNQAVEEKSPKEGNDEGEKDDDMEVEEQSSKKSDGDEEEGEDEAKEESSTGGTEAKEEATEGEEKDEDNSTEKAEEAG